MTAREMSNQLSFIEQIAQDIEGWGEGWRWLYNPDDHGKRARINRAHSIDVDVEIEIDDQTGWFYVFARQFVLPGWSAVGDCLILRAQPGQPQGTRLHQSAA